MNQGRTVLAQIMQFVSHDEFHRCVQRYDGNRRMRELSCWDQFLVMSFAQLTYRESLRDIVDCLAAHHSKLYHCGLSSPIKRSTLAEANERRDWRIYADLAQSLIKIARPLYADSPLGFDLKSTAYALDSTVIEVCLSLFPWAKYKTDEGAIKLHTMIEIVSSIPVFIDISDGKTHDLNALDILEPEPGSFIVMDRGYIDFARLYSLHLISVFFVIRARRNLKFRRCCSRKVDKSTGLRSDQTIILISSKGKRNYPERLRRISYYSVEADIRFVFLTNNFVIPALTVADLYHKRWQVELFFKWIKQHLRIKRFFGTSINAVKTQVWISISVYVLIAIIKKHFGLDHSQHTILQVLSVSLFEKKPISSLFRDVVDTIDETEGCKQLDLFEI